MFACTFDILLTRHYSTAFGLDAHVFLASDANNDGKNDSADVK